MAITPLSKAQLFTLYVQEQRPTTDIARMVGVHHSTVLDWLQMYEIPRRHPGPQIRRKVKKGG